MDERDAVQARFRLASPEERTHGQFFQDTLNGLTELFGLEVAQEARSAVAGPIDKSLFACPIGELLRATDAGAAAAEQRGLCTYPEALELIGGCLGTSYLSSPVGQAFRRMTRGDLSKSVEMSLASTRAVSSYGERRCELLSSSCARLIFRRELMGPLWIRGIYTKVFRAVSGDDSVHAVVENCQSPGMNFHLVYTWRPLR
jgi:uncharacterized protein (TIGR02265 family)